MPNLLIAVVAVGLALVLAGCTEDAAKSKAPTVAVQPVQVMAVTFEAPGNTWSYTGTVRPRFESDLGFRVGGKIVSRQVDIGQAVTVGQLIAKLDETDLRLSLEAQEAELKAARTNQEQAVAAEGRFKTLLTKGFVAQAAFDQRRATADEARSRVSRSERSLDIARNQLAYTGLKATAAGVVTSLSAEAGQVVSAGQTVVRVAQLGELEISVAVPEHMVAAVKSASADVSVWNSATDTRLAAALREVSPEADPVTRTYQAKFSLPAGTALALGRTATVHLAAKAPALTNASAGSSSGLVEAQRVTRLPLAAVMNDGRSAHVYVLDGETRVKRVAVTIASLTQSGVIVSGGLEPGQKVVTMGVHRLDGSQPVRVVEVRASTN